MATILVIDDDPAFRATLHVRLHAAGYAVVEASEGEEGMQRCEESPVDVVVTDLFIPGKEGLEMILALRKQSPTLKILAISGGGMLGNLDILQAA